MKSISKYDAKILTIFHGDRLEKASLNGTLMAAVSVTMNEKKLLALLDLLTEEEKKNVFFWVLKSVNEGREREKQERRKRLKLL